MLSRKLTKNKTLVDTVKANLRAASNQIHQLAMCPHCKVFGKETTETDGGIVIRRICGCKCKPQV